MDQDYNTLPGEDQLPASLLAMADQLRRINGYSPSALPIRLVASEDHSAYTNMNYISLSRDYMAHALPENYHGYTPTRVAEDLKFVIQHEIGHNNIHPAAKGWREEIAELPVEHYRKGYWSNVLSDVMVNYVAANGVQLTSKTPEDISTMNRAMWSAYGGGFRTCYGVKDDGFAGRSAHAALLETGQLVDNRVNNGVYTNPSTSSNYLPSETTPEWEKWVGHGRGPQYYPGIATCVGTKMPIGTDIGGGGGLSTSLKDFPPSYRQVQLRATINVEYSPNIEKWFGYNPSPGTCPLTGDPTVSEGQVIAGQYTVVGTRTYDRQENSSLLRPVEFYQIDYNGTPRWIPAHYCFSLCPHCSQPAPSQFEIGMGYKPQMKQSLLDMSPSMKSQIEGSKLYAILLATLLSGLYASSSEGFDGITGPDAGKLFLKSVAWDMHLAQIGE